MKLTRLEYREALIKAHDDPESFKIIEGLIDSHFGMIHHMKATSLWDVYEYEQKFVKDTFEPFRIMAFENEDLKKEVNKLRKQLGMCEKYKER